MVTSTASIITRVTVVPLLILRELRNSDASPIQAIQSSGNIMDRHRKYIAHAPNTTSTSITRPIVLKALLMERVSPDPTDGRGAIDTTYLFGHLTRSGFQSVDLASSAESTSSCFINALPSGSSGVVCILRLPLFKSRMRASSIAFMAARGCVS